MGSSKTIAFAGRTIGENHPTFIIAEMSGNHGHDYGRAEAILRAAAEAGADAVKLQTYTADTITLNCDNEYFKISEGPWAGRTLYDLYEEAHTPWGWQPKLKALGDSLGVEVFSTPFDATAVDFLENEVGVNLYKIASFEVVDIPLLEKVASTGKPVIVSTGMATLAEIDLAVRTLREGGAPQIALLKCVSSYPAKPDQMNLATIPHLAQTFDCVAGLSDHTLSPAVAVAAVTLGAVIVEKHFTLARTDGGPDSGFSLEPEELRQTVKMIRDAETAIGHVRYGVGAAEKSNALFRKSLFIAKDIKRGELITNQNVRSVRPGHGLPPRELKKVLGCRARQDLARGEPLRWSDIVSS
jgi:pseudaminic acid synthase